MNLTTIKEYFEKLSGEWDGNSSGKLEDQATICKEILELIEELQQL